MAKLTTRTELAQLEETIANGLRTFVEVGRALARIRDGRLYSPGGFETFEHYCQERWDMGRAHAYRLIDAAAVVENVSRGRQGKLTPPTAERQARELARLPPNEQPETWAEAVKTAPAGKVTAKHVAAVVNARSAAAPEPAPFHTLIALGDLREGLERVIKRARAEWPERAHPLIAMMLDNLLGELQADDQSPDAVMLRHLQDEQRKWHASVEPWDWSHTQEPYEKRQYVLARQTSKAEELISRLPYPLHPAAEVFPLMAPRDFDAFCESVSKHGLLKPITLYQGQILDGKIRALACVHTGVEPRYTEHTGDDPWAFVWSMNGLRANYDGGQRAAIMLKLSHVFEAERASARN